MRRCTSRLRGHWRDHGYIDSGPVFVERLTAKRRGWKSLAVECDDPTGLLPDRVAPIPGCLRGSRRSFASVDSDTAPAMRRIPGPHDKHHA